MIWPVGELQLFYKMTSSRLLKVMKEEKGGKEEMKRDDLSASYV